MMVNETSFMNRNWMNGWVTLGVGFLLVLLTSPINAADIGSRTPPIGLLVSSGETDQILIYDGLTGQPLRTFAEGGDLDAPRGFTFGPDGDLYVVSSGNAAVNRYDGFSGVYRNRLVSSGSGGLTRGFDLLFRQDGELLVTDPLGDRMLRFDGITGAYHGNLIFTGSGGLDQPNSFIIHTDGLIYLASSVNGDAVFRFNAMTGAFVDHFVQQESGGIDDPQDLVFGPDGNLYVSSHRTNEVLRYNGQTGAFLGTFVNDGSGGLQDPKGLAFGPDGNFYVVSNITDEVLRYNGQTGEFIDEFIIARSGGLNGPIEIEFHSFNLAPSEPKVEILPKNPTTQNDLFAVATESVDPNLQPVQFTYSWLLDGMAVEIEPGIQVSGPVLPHHFTQPGQQVECLVTPSDGEFEGPAGSDTTIISSEVCPPSGDLFPDGEVDALDLLILVNQWKGLTCN